MIAHWLSVGLSNAVFSLVLTAGVWLLCRRLKSAPLVHALWLLVLVKLLAPPLIAWPAISWPESPEISAPNAMSTSPEFVELCPVPLSAQELRPVNAMPAPPTFHWPHWTWLLASVWLAGTSVWLAAALVRTLRFERMLARHGQANAAWQHQSDLLAARLGIQFTPRVLILPARIPPLVWAIWRSRTIVIPRELATTLDRRERGMLLTHELAHLARRDHWVRRFEILVRALYWWNPAVGLACRKLREAEEACCDAWVAWLWPQGAREYARLLVTTLDYLAGDTPLPRGACGFASFQLLTRRFAMILERSSARRLSWSAQLLLVLAALPVLALSATAQAEPADKPNAPSPATSKREKTPVAKPHTIEEERNRADELLLARVDCSAKDLPLAEFLKQISGGPERCQIVLDEARLKADEGLSPSHRVTFEGRQIRRQAALRTVLEPLGARFRVVDGLIQVTSQAGIDAFKIRTRRHYVADLLTSPWQSAPADAKTRFSELQIFIESTVAPAAWRSGDHSLRLDDDPRYLQVRASESSHEQIANLLDQIRTAPDGWRGSEQLVKRLGTRHDFSFQNTPLADVLTRIGNDYGVSIHIAPTTLQAAGLSFRKPITLAGQQMTLAEVLNRLLLPLDLYYKIDDEVIKIESDKSDQLITRTYSVFDLISPDNAKASLEALSRRIKSDESWLDIGEITPFPNNLSLVISQSERGHEAVGSYLTMLRNKNKNPISFFIGVER